jgi:hypothetical protein
LLTFLPSGVGNITTDEFEKIVKDWIASSKHPWTKQLYTEMVYQPMLEILAYQRANGFKSSLAAARLQRSS